MRGKKGDLTEEDEGGENNGYTTDGTMGGCASVNTGFHNGVTDNEFDSELEVSVDARMIDDTVLDGEIRDDMNLPDIRVL